MHNKPHTDEAKEKIRQAKLRAPRKWGHLPEKEIVNRLFTTAATTRSIAAEYGCSDSTIKKIFQKHTTLEERLLAKNRKQAATKRGRPNPQFREWRRTHDVWTGRKHTEEAKQKQSRAKKGKKKSLKQRIEMSARAQGISIEEWTRFASSTSQRFKNSIEYKEWRTAVFTRDNYTCQQCGDRGCPGHKVYLHAHHIKSKAQYPENALDIDNGITLCVACIN